MNRIAYTSSKILALLLLSIVLIVVSGQSYARQSATKVRPSESTTVMQRFLEDQQPIKMKSALVDVPCVDGMAGIYPCSNVDLLAFMPFSDLDGGTARANDIWGWTDSGSGREFAIMGRTNGTIFVEVTDPINPVYLGNLPTHTSNSSWRDIKVYADHAYIVSEASDHGMQVFDLTQLLSVTTPTTFSNTAHFGNFGSAHNVVINEDSGFAYGVGTKTCSAGLHMVDITSPADPVDAGCFSADGYTHDAQCVMYNGPDTDHTGKEICLNSNEDTLTVVDVTTKSNPIQLSRTGYSGVGYTHQGWLTEDHAYFLLGDELDEQNFGHVTRTYIWDVRDLDNPVWIGTYNSPNAAIDHNLYIKDGLVYQSNYRAGLRILDSSDVANGNLTEVAYFDVYPADDNPQFDGTWSNYPYYDSGIVVVSHIGEGLFILKPNIPATFLLNDAPTNEVIEVCGAGNGSASFILTRGALTPWTDPVAMSVSGVPAGVAADFSAAMVTPSDSPGTAVTLNITNTSGAIGAYTLDVLADGNTIQQTSSVQFNILGTVSAPTLLSPADGRVGSPTTPSLIWSPILGVASYTIELATDAAFTNIIETGVTTESNWTPDTMLNPSSTYYWRVQVDGKCGGSEITMANSFTTSNQICSTPNANIPDNSFSGVYDFFTVDSLEGEISDLSVSIRVPHTYIGDLVASLTHIETGTTVNLFTQVVFEDNSTCPGSLLDMTLSDSAAQSVDTQFGAQCQVELTGTYQPEQSLAAFEGEEIAGSWQLYVADVGPADLGTLEQWCLLPAFAGNPTATSLNMMTTTSSVDVATALTAAFTTLLVGSAFVLTGRPKNDS